MSLKNFSNEDLNLDKSYLSLDERPKPHLSLDSESFPTHKLSSKNECSLNNMSSLNEESSNILHMFTQNKRKISKLPNVNTKKRSKLGKSWVWKYMKKDKLNKKIRCQVWVGDSDKKQQCLNPFELKTSTTNLVSHLQADHRLDKNRPLLPLSSVKEITQQLTV
ncbi:24510_t:CDS:2 [Dentiscutata erythropus]|uniref:24510_t:CDS:1 n=1 Tax=Dentiscutata erythropus TaxID=1348616 RepID=A0A9N9FNN2_9GLOM|nr:24510_t:CDS:2 [Dentiscutata erythropus]